MITFILAYQYRKAIAVVLGFVIIIGAFWYGISSLEKQAFEKGKVEGAQAAWAQAEQAQAITWEANRRTLDEEYRHIADAQALLAIQRQELTVKDDTAALRRKLTVTSAAEHAAMAEVLITRAMTGPAVLELQEPPRDARPTTTGLSSLITEALDNYKIAYTTVAGELNTLEGIHLETLALARDTTALYEQQLVVVREDLAQTSEQRDFYEAAFNEGATKKPHGFWHCFKRVVTLGIVK